ELALGRKDKDLILGKILARQGRFSFRLSLYEEAKELLQESLSLLLPADAPQEEAFALNNLGDVDRVQGDYAQANQFHRRALAIYQEIGDQSGVARSLNHLGIGAASLGEFRA
ncbi:MAG: tetratricopeptide repeat protein, partial [Anaerolineae bacterium]|nr:tetratricopeptide repeat protein [Anaerolineae bacterium]NIO00350.1 tetratricopeptide repeat protein [Anaerolineae bacterium]